MNTRIIFSSFALAVLVLIFSLESSQAQRPTPTPPPKKAVKASTVGTAFSYQGDLKLNGNPVTGTCDLRFGLWDSLSAGSQAGASPQTKPAVAIANGLLTAELDFGNAFDGNARWLEIEVRCPAGSGSYTLLAPRQPLNATPYAQYAMSAPWSGMIGTPSGFSDGVDNDALGSLSCSNGQVPKWNGATWTCGNDDGGTAYTAGTGLTLSGNQFSITNTFQLPQACSNGQLAKWNGTAWTCASDSDTTYTAGMGLGLSGNQFSVTVPYRLPQSCANGQMPRWNSALSLWQCTDASSGDVTDVNAGTGISVTNPTGPAPTVTLGTRYRLPQTCTNNQLVRWNNTSLLWECTDANGGDVTDVNAGTGISVTNPTGPAPTVILGTRYRLPQTCVNNQIARWNNTSLLWECIDANGGDVTDVLAGTGVTITNPGGPSPTVTLGTRYRLPQTCTNNQLARWNNTTLLWECIDASGGDVTDVNAGTGISVTNPTGPAPTVTLGTRYRLPQTCTNNQIAKWNNTSLLWECTDASGGDVTDVNGAFGIAVSNSTGPAPTVYLENEYQLPQECASGMVPMWNATLLHWDCASVGDVKNVSAGTGIFVNQPEGPTPMIYIAATYRLPQTCANDQLAKWNGSAWVCSNDDNGGGSSWSLVGNVGTNPATNFIGTTDNVMFTIGVSNTAALRLIPTASSPNIIGGYSGNSVNSGIVGGVVVGGGREGNPNQVTADWGTVAGGYGNNATGSYATVVGGRSNTASGENSTIGGGWSNTVTGGGHATIGGGYNNSTTSDRATIAGGYSNNAGYRATVGGGENNTASGESSTIGGGTSNTASRVYSTIAGGRFNIASGENSTIGGGWSNTVIGYHSVIGGGLSNSTTNDRATIAGGTSNTAGYRAAVGGGASNSASSDAATIGGGTNNTNSGQFAFIGAGSSNNITVGADYAVIAGGLNNRANDIYTTVAGGYNNRAGDDSGGGQGTYGTVGGGAYNTASGFYSTVPGGTGNIASGGYSFAAGRGARAGHLGAFVWADSSTDVGFDSTANNQFAVRANGGVNFQTGDGPFKLNGNTVWTSGNHGEGSGLNADLLDGQHASSFAPNSRLPQICSTVSQSDWVYDGETFIDVTQCSINLPTNGYVFMEFNAQSGQIYAGSGTEGHLVMVIDGSPIDYSERVFRFNYGDRLPVSSSMIVPLSAGTHTVGVRARKGSEYGNVWFWRYALSVITILY